MALGNVGAVTLVQSRFAVYEQGLGRLRPVILVNCFDLSNPHVRWQLGLWGSPLEEALSRGYDAIRWLADPEE